MGFRRGQPAGPLYVAPLWDRATSTIGKFAFSDSLVALAKELDPRTRGRFWLETFGAVKSRDLHHQGDRQQDAARSFSLFYMKAVAPPEITMSDIYWSVISCVLVTFVGVPILIAFPDIALYFPTCS